MKKRFLFVLLVFILLVNSAQAITEFSYIGINATASSYQSVYIPSRVFDHDILTDWGSAIGNPQWLKIDFGSSSNELTEYSVTPSTSNGIIYYPTSWMIQGSNDDTIWSLLDLQTGQSATNTNPKNYASLSQVVNKSTFRYYRMYILIGGTGGNNIYAEWSLFGNIVTSQPPVISKGIINISVIKAGNTYINWKWNNNNSYKMYVDGYQVQYFDNASASFILTGLQPSEQHSLTVYNATGTGYLLSNTTGDINIGNNVIINSNVSTSSPNQENLIGIILPYGLFLLGVIIIAIGIYVPVVAFVAVPIAFSGMAGSNVFLTIFMYFILFCASIIIGIGKLRGFE